jgi:[protein-PII] uridylyltransferase
MEGHVERLRLAFREGRAELFPAGARTAPCRELMARHAALIDGLVAEIYRVSCEFADGQAGRTGHSGLGIIATGGYGRKELSPFSDVDIAFIPSEEQDPWVEAAVHAAFKLVMDVFLSFREVHVGYSFRPISELPTWDLPTKVSLLDARHLCGDPRLSGRLQEQLRWGLSPLDLMLEINELEEREERTPDAALYSVEPDLKEGNGSLRDLHRARWIYKLLLGVDENDLLPELEHRGLMSSIRIAEIKAAAEWFWRARNWLHLTAGKCSDVLINNYQDRIASELGSVSAQEWLSQHFSHAETLSLFRDAAVRHALAGPIDLGGVQLENGHLFRRRIHARPDPGRAVKLIHLSQRYNIPISLVDLQDLETSRAAAAQVTEAAGDEAWAFLGILREGRNVAATLRQLVTYGLMNRFIDRFCEVMRFVPPDPAHRFTVGEHSLRIVEYLENLRNSTDAQEQRFAELMAQCSHFDVLCLAALIHDAGKLISDSEHSEQSLTLTASIARRLKLAPEKKELLDLLVGQHLLLVRTGRLHDLKTPAVIQGVAEKIPSVDALRHLYVFSYVDTRAVAKKNWTSMDHRDLEELFRKVQGHLMGQFQEESAAEIVEGRIGEIRHSIARSSEPQSDEAVRRHCDAMPASYILNTPLDEIALHIKLIGGLETENVVLDLYNRPGDDYSELTVCAYDDPQPGMLAKITGVLYACDAGIQKAQVFTMHTERPVVLDTLWIHSAGRQVSEARARRVMTTLKEVLSGKRTLEKLLGGMGKHLPAGIPLDSVDLRNDISEEHTVVHVIAGDLQGLLYMMTRALSRSGLHIHSARVATWAGRAENNFYVTTLDGRQIPDDELSHWQESLQRALCGLDES